MTNFDLEKYKDGLPIIEPKNPFLDIAKVNINNWAIILIIEYGLGVKQAIIILKNIFIH